MNTWKASVNDGRSETLTQRVRSIFAFDSERFAMNFHKKIILDE